jgi:hypothetical protein
MLQAEFAPMVAREGLFLEAKDALIACETAAPGRGAWLMACLNMRMGSVALARKWLERAHAAGHLPARTVIVASAYMAELKGEDWFEDFMARVE